MTSDANGVYRGVYTYGEERISVRDLVEVEGVPNDPLYYMYDGRGSVSQLTNAVGNVRDKYRYTPFGEEMSGGQLSPNTKLLNNPYGYNGEYHDLESGFQYLRARYYNPETARFITRDSYLGKINEPLTLNRYAYTANNPVKYKDPSGNDFEDGTTGTRARSVNTSTKSASSRPVVGWGSRGDAVVIVQNILDEQGYYLGPSGVDGVYGDYTNKAIKSYQTANGLQPDGIVGPKTWGSFNSYVNSKAAESKDRSKNSKSCGDVDAVSGAARDISDVTQKLDSLMLKYENKYENVKDLPYPIRLKMFYDLVKNKAELDLKNKPDWKDKQYIYNGEIIDNDVPGNIMFGYMGKVFRLQDTVLYAGAGYAQKKAGTSKDEWNNFESFGDDPRDTARIKQGIKIYNEKHKTILDRGFESLKKKFNRK